MMPESEIVFLVQESPEAGYEARALGQPLVANTFESMRRG